MKVLIASSFSRDVKAIDDRTILQEVRQIIATIERADSIHQISGIRKMKGYAHHYRIRCKDYRIGAIREKDALTLVRILPRKDIYNYYP